jgi:uncharacterized integral membrane protein
MLALLVLLLALVAVGLGFFTVQNAAVDTVHFWSWTWSVPAWYIPVAAAIGVFVAFLIYSLLVGTRWRVRHLILHRSRAERQMTIEELRHENARLKGEVARLQARGDRDLAPAGLSGAGGAARRLLRLR